MADGALQPPRCCSFFGTNGLYDAVGNLDDFVYPNGVKHAYTYTEQNRLKNLTLTRGDSTLLRSFSYQLSAAGHRVGVAETNLVEGTPVQRRRVAYEYDRDNWGGPAPARVYRLTRESLFGAEDAPTGSITHAYDKVGNRTGRTVSLSFEPAEDMQGQSFAFDRRDLLDGDGDPDNANDRYDADGNTLKDESGSATGDVYDAENRLIQRGVNIQVGYDHEGNRVWKVVNGVTNCYLLDNQNPSGYVQVLAEYVSDSTQAPTLSRSYAYGQDLISQVIHSSSFNPQPSTNYYGYDGHGSVRVLIDATSAAAVTDMYDYDAYGVLLAVTDTTPNNYRYTGEQWDSDLGMYFLRARYYKPELGRFWTMDYYQGRRNLPTSLHKYTYCSANPANATDFSGFEFSIWIGAGTGYANFTAPKNPLKVAGPTVGDQLLGGPDSREVDQTKWFETHYAGWLAHAKQYYTDSIDRTVQRQPQKRYIDVSIRLPVLAGVNEDDFGDRTQSLFSQDKILGSFVFMLSR